MGFTEKRAQNEIEVMALTFLIATSFAASVEVTGPSCDHAQLVSSRSQRRRLTPTPFPVLFKAIGILLWLLSGELS